MFDNVKLVLPLMYRYQYDPVIDDVVYMDTKRLILRNIRVVVYQALTEEVS